MNRDFTRALLLGLAVGAAGACSSASHSPYQPPPLDEGGSATFDASADSPASHTDAGVDAPVDVSVSTAQCLTTLRYAPPTGTSPKVVTVSGDWNQFASPGTAMVGPDSTGAFTAQVPLQPGLVAYKFIVDGTWTLDPNEHWQKYVGGVANSAVQVQNCHLPTLALSSNATTRPSAGQGHYTASVAFVPGQGAPPSAIVPRPASSPSVHVTWQVP